MDEASWALLVGSLGVVASAAFMSYVSIVDDALHNYNLALLFEQLDKDVARRTRFEELSRRDDEFIQAASIGRVIGFMVHSASWIVLISSRFSDFTFTALGYAALMSIMVAIAASLIVPPLIIRKRYETTLRRMLPGFRLAALPLKPITAIGSLFRSVGARLEGAKPAENAEEQFQSGLADRLEEGALEGVLDEKQRAMIHNVVELSRTTAEKAMVPRTDMAAANLDEGLDAAIKLAKEHGHARVPIYQGTRDKIVGILFVRDLLATYTAGQKPTLKDLMHTPRFWPESITLDKLLEDMKRERLSIGVLVDEHGGTAGLITLEDILEEIVGDIRDEFDKDETKRRHTSITPFVKDQAEADGDVDIDELNRKLELSLPESPDYNSLAGFMIYKLGHMPAVDESLEVDGVRLTAIAADERRVKRVRISKMQVETETGAERG
ncbi:MAG: HlyC/CorC family transporter [Planctomycetes bacterium]|nr:HlyC/CorC family transporter [Planctomycetota bacterium]